MKSFESTLDLRSPAQPVRRERKRSQKYDHWRTVNPGQLDQPHAMGKCIWEYFAEDPSYTHCGKQGDRCLFKVFPANLYECEVRRPKKRELFKAAQSAVADRVPCSCCYRRPKTSKKWRNDGRELALGEERWQEADYVWDFRNEDLFEKDRDIFFEYGQAWGTSGEILDKWWHDGEYAFYATQINLGELLLDPTDFTLPENIVVEGDDDWSVISDSSDDDNFSIISLE